MPSPQPTPSVAFPDEEVFRSCLMQAIVEASDGDDRVALWCRGLQRDLATRLASPDRRHDPVHPTEGGDRGANMLPGPAAWRDVRTEAATQLRRLGIATS